MLLNTQFRRNVAGGISIVLIFSVMFAIVFSLYNVFRGSDDVGLDSGVVACQKIIENAEDGRSAVAKDMTEADYKKAREPYQNSKYADLKTAGTTMIETVYMAQNNPDDSFKGSVDLLTNIRTNWIILQSACGRHGVNIPSLPSS
jgi:hypothetical protein